MQHIDMSDECITIFEFTKQSQEHNLTPIKVIVSRNRLLINLQ